MLRRRAHPLRKSSRRLCTISLSSPLQHQIRSLPSPNPELQMEEPVVNCSTSPSECYIEEFARQLQAMSTKSRRNLLLSRLQEEVQTGNWGASALQTTISLLKKDPENSFLREIAENLATISPTEDTRDIIIRAPEAVLWWEDLVQLLPCPTLSSSFHYTPYVLSYIRSLREAITSRTLPIGHFLSLRQLPHEQQTLFLRLLRIEHANEVEEDLIQAITKAFECANLCVAQMERIHCVLQTRPSEIRNYEAAAEAARDWFDGCYSMSLQDWAVPSVLKKVLTIILSQKKFACYRISHSFL